MTGPAFGIVGWQNAGKTTLIEALIGAFAKRGLAVSTVKHAHHDFDIDQAGKDSHRHRTAGAREVLVGSAQRWALMHELRGAPEPSLDALLARLAAVDLVLVEGFKSHSHPKLEVVRTAMGRPLLAASDPTVVAVAADGPLVGLRVPVLPLADAPAIADFIAGHLGLGAAARRSHAGR